MEFDVFLACAPKDYNKLPYAVKAIAEHVVGYSDLIICTPTEIPAEYRSKLPAGWQCYYDINALPGGDIRNGWGYRPNWCFQQHLKLFQVWSRPWYVTIDCDTIINRDMHFFEDGKPVYWLGYDQYFQPYFTWQKRMVGIDRVYPHSFIADMNLFYRPIIAEMLMRYNYTIQTFIQRSQEITTETCCIGEPELYGNYCEKYHPDLYVKKQLKQKDIIGSRVQTDSQQKLFNESEIEDGIKIAKSMDVDTISFHSWFEEK